MTLGADTHAFYSDNTASIAPELLAALAAANNGPQRSEEHTSELQSPC